MHAGDMFAWKALPYIDTSNGGSVVSHAETLRKAVSTIQNVDTVITGHTPVLTWNELREYADFNSDFVSWAREQIKAGKAVGEAAAEYQVPAKYKGYSVSPNLRWAMRRRTWRLCTRSSRNKATGVPLAVDLLSPSLPTFCLRLTCF